MKQSWSALAFFHWEIDPEVIHARLPVGLTVDRFQNKAYLGIVPFFMERVRPAFLPPLPWLSWFHELNVRTYVHDENGTPGVWFFSLDCDQPLAVEVARRWFHLPYQHAAMNSQRGEESVRYQSRRKNLDLPVADFRYPIVENGKEAAPDSLEFFLLERYTLFSADKTGRLHHGGVHHPPYRFMPTTEFTCSTLPFAWNHLDEPATPPVSSLVAETLEVDIFPLRKFNPGA